MQVTGRRCENCGLGMLPFMPRKRGPDGKLWCRNCHEGRPGRPRAQASRSGEAGAHPDALSPTTVEAVLAMEEESERLERAESLLGAFNDAHQAVAEKYEPMVVIAHDSGDGQTIFHCPFCGGGQVVGRSDGTTECAFCGTAFTVQVQPLMSAMPQTAYGQPVDMPGMPAGGTDPTAPDAAGETPQSAAVEQVMGDGAADAFQPPGGAPGAAGAPGDTFVPPQVKAASLAAGEYGYDCVNCGHRDAVHGRYLGPTSTANWSDHCRKKGCTCAAPVPPDNYNPETGKTESSLHEAGRFDCPGSNTDPLPSEETKQGTKLTHITPTYSTHHPVEYGVCATCNEPKKLLKSGKLPKHTRHLDWKQQGEMGLRPEGSLRTEAARVMVIGPGIGGKMQFFEIHAADCPDLQKRKYMRFEKDWVFDADSQEQVVEEVYGDQMNESGGSWTDYAGDLKFFPCTGLPKTATRKQSFYVGPDGVAMPHESYIRHLALRFADDRDVVLTDIRESNLA